MSFFVVSISQSFAQNTSDISISISTPPPQFNMLAVGNDGIDIEWDWDNVSPGYIPPAVTNVRVELSSDSGLNYSNMTNNAPGDFAISYTSLSAGTYNARVTVFDGNDFEYVIGPVTLSGGGRRGGGGGGGTGGEDSDPDPDPVTNTTVVIQGLAYPGPTTVVIFTYETGFEATINPDANGAFSYTTDQLPAGEGVFSFSARDPENRLSAPFQNTYNVPEGFPFLVNDVALPPTIAVSETVATVSEPLTVEGYAFKEGSISVTMAGPSSVAFLAQADEQGYWTIDIDTSVFGPGTYSLTAVATSEDDSLTSPNSSALAVELLPSVPSAAVCGDGVVEDAEQCDDGNTANGDGCSAACTVENPVCGDGFVTGAEECDDGNLQDGDGCSAVCELEQLLPRTEIDQPSPSVFGTDTVDLSYSVLAEPNGAVSTVTVFYALNGANYVVYPETFSGGQIQLTGLAEGDYEVYSRARDVAGFLELAPPDPDAQFTVDAIEDFEVHAYPEKRIPAQGNWSMPADLALYVPGQQTAAYEYTFATGDDGYYTVDLSDPVTPRSYNALIKGVSHLSKRIDAVDFSDLSNMVIDFTLNQTFFLIAGDVHPGKDDFVNALDISALVSYLYESSQDGDLNLDTTVNALDLSILVGNLYKQGDGI